MNILWTFPLLVIVWCGMAILIMRPKPFDLRTHVYLMSKLLISSCAVYSLSHLKLPSGEIIIMTWGIATLMALSASREVQRRSAK